MEHAIAGLTGEIAQVPSAVSAIKVNGQRSYARVRAGHDVVLTARPVTVRRFDILDQRTIARRVTGGHQVWDLDVIVEVSSGTYIRALARDLGTILCVGGPLTALRRTRVGRSGLDIAHSFGDLWVASAADVSIGSGCAGGRAAVARGGGGPASPGRRPEGAGAAARRPAVRGARAARARYGGRIWPRLDAGRAGGQVPKRRPLLGLAVGFPGGPPQRRSS